MNNLFLLSVLVLGGVGIVLLLWTLHLHHQQQRALNKMQSSQDFFQTNVADTSKLLLDFQERLQQQGQQQTKTYHQFQLDSVKLIQENLLHLQQQLLQLLTQKIDAQSSQIHQLTNQVDTRLKDISGQVDKRLQEGFEKTTSTFTDVVKRLALIDEAQKKITELSTNVVSLQEVLADKRSRGVFGEVQLAALVRNVLPEAHFALQHTLTNGKRCDCILLLPEPTGSIVIDAKFPLETFRRLQQATLSETEQKALTKQFKQDVRAHIKAIAEKYIVLHETADSAIMFIPAEAIFAEIHSYHADLVEEAHQQRVWLTSPTTLMAVLNTARAILKDAATRQQISLIQKYLQELSKDFDRFQTRMDQLAKHISQAHKDVQDVHISASKITDRFGKIERVEFKESQDL
jgi:DNA recombination protein RmuC